MTAVTGPGHYGEWLSAHLDGELSRAQDARLQVHLLQCASCAEALVAEEDARSLLLAAADAEPSAALTARLLALACPPDGAQTPGGAPEPAHLAPRGGAHRYAARGGRARPQELRTLRPGEDSPTYPALTGELRSRRSIAAAVVVGVVGLGLGAGGLSALGAPPRVVPSAHRAEALTTLARTLDAAEAVPTGGASVPRVEGVSLIDPAESDPALSTLREGGWYIPHLVEGARLVDHRTDGDGRLELEVATSEGVLVLREQVGTLDVESLSAESTLTWGTRTVHVLSQTPWHATWQAGDLVLEVYCADVNPLAEGIVAAAGTDVAAPVTVGRRIARGWQSIVSVVSGR